MRHYAITQGLFDKNNQMHHKATVYGDEFDRKVDYGMRESLQKEEQKFMTRGWQVLWRKA